MRKAGGPDPSLKADGSVILVEMEGLSLVRISPRGDREVLAHIDGGPNGAAIGPDGGVYITNNGGAFTFLDFDGNTVPGPPPQGHGAGGSIQRFDLRSRELETLYTHHDGRPLISPNDLVFDRQGGMWFTDHGSMAPNGRVFGGIFYARPDGSHIQMCRDGLISLNGIGLSPDETVLYASDTFIGRLWSFDIVSPGVLAEPEPFRPGRAIHNLQGIQYLDSLAVEAGGRICVGTILNGGITVFDPDGSAEHVPFPDLVCTNICFGGPDMRDAWITAAGSGKLELPPSERSNDYESLDQGRDD